MRNNGETKHKATGTFAYDNWLAFRRGEPEKERYECLLYSDAFTIGEVRDGIGPYQFVNLIPTYATAAAQPVFVFSYSIHTEYPLPQTEKTDASRYVGGNVADELAALASLACGIRLRAGAVTRCFWPDDGPAGTPVWWTDRPDPVLIRALRSTVLPLVRGEHSIKPVERMQDFMGLTPEQSVALVRAARLYQDALWVAESEPHLAWIMLVSAVESVASLSDASRLELFTEYYPEFVAKLDSFGPGISGLVADKFADTVKSTAKFISFMIDHLPDPPANRPAEWVQVEWTDKSMKRAMNTIYACRSRALHEGIPFPPPMCEPPLRYEEWKAPAEKPPSQGMSRHGGAWTAKDTPMLLHTFEYIARNAINDWWSSVAEAQSSPPADSAGPTPQTDQPP